MDNRNANKMYVHKYFHRKAVISLVGIIFLFGVMMTTSGCEPLRKKFTRKKKKDRRTAEIVPILDPVDYPAKVQTTDSLYRHHYSLWQVWHRDLINVFEDKGSDKKIAYILKQMMVQLEEMSKLLGEKQRELLLVSVEKLRNIEQRMKMPASVRNNHGIRRKVERIGKQVRRNFRFQQVEDDLVKSQ